MRFLTTVFSPSFSWGDSKYFLGDLPEVFARLLQRSCGVTESVDSPVCYTHRGRNPLYLGYKLPVEDPSVEGGNFVLKKASSTRLGIGFLR